MFLRKIRTNMYYLCVPTLLYILVRFILRHFEQHVFRKWIFELLAWVLWCFQKSITPVQNKRSRQSLWTAAKINISGPKAPFFFLQPPLGAPAKVVLSLCFCECCLYFLLFRCFDYFQNSNSRRGSIAFEYEYRMCILAEVLQCWYSNIALFLYCKRVFCFSEVSLLAEALQGLPTFYILQAFRKQSQVAFPPRPHSICR